MLSRKVLLLLFVALPAFAAERPNIVLIVTDNQSEKVLGAYGNEDIKTPHIDSLAEQGMLFRQAFSASGVCSPTRATLMTGLMPSQHGVHNAMPSQFEIENWAAVEEYRNLPQTLSESGYATGLVGKYHLGDAYKAQMGFEYWVTFPTGHTTKFHGNDIIDNGETYQLDEEQHLTDFWTDKALQFIEEQDIENPFFLYVSYNGPYNLPPLVIEYPKNRHAEYYENNIPQFPQEPVNPSLRRLAIKFSNVDVLLAEQDEWWVTDEERVDENTAKAENAWPWQTIAALNNPIDLTGSAMDHDFVKAVKELSRIPQIDAIIVLLLPYIPGITSDLGARLSQISRRENKPLVAYVPHVEKYRMLIEGFELNHTPVSSSIEGAVLMVEALRRCQPC